MNIPTPKPGERYWRALVPYCDAVSIYDGPEVFSEQFARLPRAIGVLLAAHWLDTEVCNGGFHQFFHNSTGVLAPEALAAFRALNLADAAQAVQEAIHFFGEPYPRDRAVRQTMLDSIPGDSHTERNPFTELDKRYYDARSSDRFSLAADAYAEQTVAS